LEKSFSIANAINKTQALILAAIMIVAIVAGASYVTMVPRQMPQTGSSASTTAPAGTTVQVIHNNTLVITEVGAIWGNQKFGCDPALDYGSSPYNLLMYESLFAFDPIAFRDQGGVYKVVPWLAQSYTVSPDGLVYTINLRQGIRFHSGNTMTADDVVYSLNRVLFYDWTPLATYTVGGFASYSPDPGFKSVQKVDDYTVTITLAGYMSETDVTGYLTSIITSILDSKLVQAHEMTIPELGNAKDFGYTWLNDGNEAGSGPYTATSIVPASSWQVHYFDGYWGPPPELNLPKPTIKNVIIVKDNEDTDTRLKLLKGDIDIASDFVGQTVASLANDPTVKITGGPAQTGFHLDFHCVYGPLKDWRVRKAIKMSINYTQVVQQGAAGQGYVIEGIIQRHELGWEKTAHYFADAQYDQANKLLDEAGYPVQADGFRFHINLYIRPQPRYGLDFVSIGLIVRANLQNVHIDVAPIVMNPSEFYGHVYTPSEQMMWVQAYDDFWTIDPLGLVDSALGPAARVNAEPGGKYGWNQTTQIPDQVNKIDSEYAYALSVHDPAQRLNATQTLDMDYLEYGPMVGLVQGTNHVAYNAHLTGVFWGPRHIWSCIWFIQWSS
jgi:peptide/nickel transport system substrate-binding protein